MSHTQCSHPGCTSPHDNWPGPGVDDMLCQDHWEACSGAMWWEQVRAMAKLGKKLGKKLGMSVVAEC